MRIVCSGAGGFIGGYLCARLISEGHDVRAVDIKPLSEWWQVHDTAENIGRSDLHLLDECRRAVDGREVVYNLSAEMGGMNFVENHKLTCMLNVLINTHMLMASNDAGVERFFFSGSACCYSASKQTDENVTALKESDAYPAQAEDGYGWEKLFSERMCEHFNEETTMAVRTARFHNVYGPNTSYDDLRGKAPASLSRKVAEAIANGDESITVWGDGHQTRSFMWIDDCVEGVLRITALEDGQYRGPMNLGSSELVSINELVDIIEKQAGASLRREHDLTKPLGVRGRNSDNQMIRDVLDGWEPSTPLREGIGKLYPWVEARVMERHGG